MKIGFLPSTALLALLIATPALAEGHDHGGKAQPEAAAGSTTGSSGAAAGTATGASAGTGGTHHHGSGTFGGTVGGGAGSGTGVTVTTGGGSGTGSTGDTHRHDHTGLGGNNPFTGNAGAGGSSGGGITGSGGTGGTHHDRGTGAVINNPFTGTPRTGGSNATGGTGHDHGTRFNNGVTIFAPHTHWGNRGNHNDFFDQFRRIVNANRRFHHGAYYRPNGWYAHNWRFGEFLPYVFFSQQYWIDDWEDFGLDEPPPGTEWVRYGNDALLIDEDTGEVIEVVYGLFY